jgi:penicillin-binding protein-related factor A (putative recombinase)
MVVLWKEAETAFRSSWERNPAADLYRFEDMADIKFGKQQATRIVARKPSDYIVTYRGQTFYAEVKSVEKDPRFSFDKVQSGQWQRAVGVTAAGGRYLFFIYFGGVNQWFKVPASRLLELYHAGKKSANMKDLGGLEWTIGDFDACVPPTGR